MNIAEAVCIVAGILLLMSIWARRDLMVSRARSMVLAILYGLIVFKVLSLTRPTDVAAIFAIGSGAVIFYFGRPNRKRSMRAAVRRKVVSKWQLQTGRKFNPRFHEIDHVVPFSRGGNETEDNLRVIARQKNRSKAAKSPWWDLLGR